MILECYICNGSPEVERANLKSSFKVMVLGIGRERWRQLLGREKLMSNRGKKSALGMISMTGRILR